MGGAFTRDSNVVSREIGGDLVLVPVRSRVGDLDAVFTMNETGRLIWARLASAASVDDLAAALTEAFEVSPDEAQRDAAEYVATLEEAGLIRRID